MATSEIEKLERRYAENPNGLTFAPLAEIHRKNGDISRALELLGPGLERYPDYVPARIVLGRCHLDLGDPTEAEKAFTHVLGLDGENVIALKALADISERLVRYDDAERWLHTLLTIDRNNEEARQQLARLEAARQQADVGSAAVPGSDVIAMDFDPSAVDLADAAPRAETMAVVDEPSSMPDAATAVPEVAPWVSETDAAKMVAEASPAVLEDLTPLNQPLQAPEGVEQLSGLVTPESATLHPKGPTLDEDFQIETEDEMVLRPSGASEFQMPDASQDLIAARPDPDPFGMSPDAYHEPVARPSGETVAPVADEPVARVSGESVMPVVDEVDELVVDEPAADEPMAPMFPMMPVSDESMESVEVESVEEVESVLSISEESVPVVEEVVAPTSRSAQDEDPAPIVTEMMAEVLLQQGHTTDALRIYRELARRSGGDPRLRDKVSELETRLAEGPKRGPVYAARDTGGQSVGAFFRELLAARPTATAPASRPAPAPAPASSASTGAPTRPATDALSLSAVFGDESSPVPPAVSAGVKPDVSFDEFFGPPGAGRAGKATRGADPKEDDLDQFHAWLQNLKR